MVEEKKGFVDGVEVIVSTVEVKTNQRNNQQIDKITLITNKGNITWKPKCNKVEFQGGFKIINTVPMELDLLPPKLNEIAMACNEQGQCKVKIYYSYWETEQDGSLVTYRFITSQKTLDKWEIIKEEVKTETVKDEVKAV